MPRGQDAKPAAMAALSGIRPMIPARTARFMLVGSGNFAAFRKEGTTNQAKNAINKPADKMRVVFGRNKPINTNTIASTNPTATFPSFFDPPCTSPWLMAVIAPM